MNTQTTFWCLIVVLFVIYGAFKYHHISVAMQAFDGQPLTANTAGAAK
jgi:hypothetical protein